MKHKCPKKNQTQNVGQTSLKLVGDGSLAICEGRRGTTGLCTSHDHACVADGVTSVRSFGLRRSAGY